jgi:hypothetical protein
MPKCERRKLLLIFIVALVVLIMGAGRLWWAESSHEYRASQYAGSISSPTPVIASKASAKIKRPLENLILPSQSASAEVHADLLLTIASANLISDKKRRVELLNEAFQAASRMKEPVTKKSWAGLISVAERSVSMVKKREVPAESLSTKVRDFLLRNMAGE